MGSYIWTVGEYKVSLLLYVTILFIGLIIFIPLILFRKWYFNRKRIKNSVITADFEPPSKLSPAEIQYLFGGVEHDRIIGATIIHLVQRGVLHMRRVDGEKKVFPGPKETLNLKQHEKMLVVIAEKENGISAAAMIASPIAFTDEETQINATTISEYIHHSLREQKLIEEKNVNKFFIDSIKVSAWLIFSLVWWPLFLFWFLSVLLASSSDISSIVDFIQVIAITSASLAIPITIASIFIVKWRARLIGRRWMSTTKLIRLWPQLMGYRHFVKLTERDRLKFETEKLKDESNKDILPYAVALGFIKDWRNIIS
jgi:hypothetical protein